MAGKAANLDEASARSFRPTHPLKKTRVSLTDVRMTFFFYDDVCLEVGIIWKSVAADPRLSEIVCAFNQRQGRLNARRQQ
jgi:hypothetical protein